MFFDTPPRTTTNPHDISIFSSFLNFLKGMIFSPFFHNFLYIKDWGIDKIKQHLCLSVLYKRTLNDDQKNHTLFEFSSPLHHHGFRILIVLIRIFHVVLILTYTKLGKWRIFQSLGFYVKSTIPKNSNNGLFRFGILYIEDWRTRVTYLRARFSYLLELFLVLNFFSGLQAWFFYFPAKD